MAKPTIYIFSFVCIKFSLRDFIFLFWIFLFLFWFLKIQFNKQQSTDYIMNYHENPFLYMISIPENTEIQNNWNIRGTKHFHFRGNDNNIDILCSLNPTLKKCISMYFQWFGVSVLPNVCAHWNLYSSTRIMQTTLSVIQFQRKKKTNSNVDHFSRIWSLILVFIGS